MNITKLSSKGQVIIPKPLRAAHHWDVGQELVIIEHEDGVLLRPRSAFEKTIISEVASCLRFSGKAKTIEDMENAISKGVKDKFQ